MNSLPIDALGEHVVEECQTAENLNNGIIIVTTHS
jgi:hypothetical protein